MIPWPSSCLDRVLLGGDTCWGSVPLPQAQLPHVPVCLPLCRVVGSQSDNRGGNGVLEVLSPGLGCCPQRARGWPVSLALAARPPCCPQLIREGSQRPIAVCLASASGLRCQRAPGKCSSRGAREPFGELAAGRPAGVPRSAGSAVWGSCQPGRGRGLSAPCSGVGVGWRRGLWPWPPGS